MSLSKEQIDLLLSLVDKGIDAEIHKICEAPTTPLSFISLITKEDEAFLHLIGITSKEPKHDNG